MHVLFITEKYCDCDPAKGLTNSYHNLFGSLECSGLASLSIFHPDEYMQQNQREYFTPLMFYIFQVKPDVIIATWYSTDILELFKQVKEKIGVPIVALWWDSVSQMHMAESFLPYVVFNIVVDSSVAYKTSTLPERYLPLWSPQDPRVFYNTGMVRDIDVSFLGSLNGHPYRTSCITALRDASIKVLHTGGQRESRILIKDYADITRQSKIVLNFSETPDGKTQLKGRVFEATFSGAMLLESENFETKNFFSVSDEYISFADEKSLVDEVRYYLSHEEERSKIALRGYERASKDYSAKKFWSTVFERLKT